MEIRIYDSNMDFQGIIENQKSLLWNRAFNESGSFELHAPVADYNLSLLKRGNLVWKKGAVDAGVIEDIHIEEAYDQHEIAVSGRFLPAYMDRRLVRPMFNFTGRAEVGMRTIFTNAVVIPKVQLGTLNGFTENIEFQATYKSLLSIEQKIAKATNLGFRFRPDFNEKVIYFEIYKGVDRSLSQTEHARVIFSEEYRNLNKATYQENDQLLGTVCYVGGQGEGSERVFVTVGDDALTGLERREIFINGADISSEGLTDAEYREKLRQRGLDKLNESTLFQYMECEAIPSGNFNYVTDYDLGDIVTVKKSNWGITQNLRLSAVTEAYENGTETIIPTFGTPLPATINWEED